MIVLPLIFASITTPAQLPKANASVADCVEVSSPTAYLSSSSLTITAMMRVSTQCSASVLGMSHGPVIEVVDEGFGSSCDGLYVLTPGAIGSLNCRIPIGGSFGSHRYRATSTTIKFWYAWDFSTKFITVTHQAIPAPVVASVPAPTITQTPRPTPTISTPVISPQTSQVETDPFKNPQNLTDLVNVLDSLSTQVDSLSKQLSKTYKATCKNGTQTKLVTGSNPKCPAGYTLKSKKKIS